MSDDTENAGANGSGSVEQPSPPASTDRKMATAIAPAATPPPQVTVNFAEPEWHMQRLRQVEVASKASADAAKKVRGMVTLLVLSGGITACAYFWTWPVAAQIFFLAFDALTALALLGSYTTLRDAKDTQRTAESLAQLSASLFVNKPGAAHNYFDSLVAINVENLREYYLLIKKHTSHSYRVSLAAGVFGFLLICGALVASYAKGQFTTIAYVGTGAGLVVEFIAGVFFYLYNTTVRQLKGYHDSLLDVQNVLLALKLSESVSKEDARGPMLQSMITFLMTRKVSSPENSTDASKPPKETPKPELPAAEQGAAPDGASSLAPLGTARRG